MVNESIDFQVDLQGLCDGIRAVAEFMVSRGSRPDDAGVPSVLRHNPCAGKAESGRLHRVGPDEFTRAVHTLYKL